MVGRGDKMEIERLEVGALLRRTWAVIASAPAEVGAYVLALSVRGLLHRLGIAVYWTLRGEQRGISEVFA